MRFTSVFDSKSTGESPRSSSSAVHIHLGIGDALSRTNRPCNIRIIILFHTMDVCAILSLQIKARETGSEVERPIAG